MLSFGLHGFYFNYMHTKGLLGHIVPVKKVMNFSFSIVFKVFELWNSFCFVLFCFFTVDFVILEHLKAVKKAENDNKHL